MVRHNELVLSNKVEQQLKTISIKTLDRKLGKEREIRRLKRNRGTTRHGSLLKSSIPIRITEQNKLFFTRSWPDRKNDNTYVEQKNNTHIRHWLGYGRYDKLEHLKMINDLYRNELKLFNNFFRPVMKIKSKEKINNSVCKKKYDKAQTPYQRLMNSNQILDEQKQELERLYLSLNPVELKTKINLKLNKIKNFKSIFINNLQTSMVRNYMT